MMKIALLGDSLTEGNFGVSFFDILKRDLPEHNLINFGEGGDTVISLYQRLGRECKEGPFDLVILWIGVNDIFGRMTWIYRILNRIRKKPHSRNPSEFRTFYRATLEKLLDHARMIFVIEPLFIGESPTNKWNIQLGELCQVIQGLSIEFENVEFVGLRSSFFEELEHRNLSDYLPTSVLRFFRDKATLSNADQVDLKSNERGLHFTLDGVHLNSKGAKLVSDILYGKIKKFEQEASCDGVFR